MDAAIEAKLEGRMLRNVLRDRLGKLAREVDRTRQDSGFQEALDAMRRFWRYSPLNQFLIGIQRPGATRVASRRVWASLGRKLKPDEKAIGVLAPTSWRRGRGFYPVPVYDVRQTRGRRLPTLVVSSRGGSRHVRTLEAAAARLRVRVEYGGVSEDAAAESLGGTVRVRRSLSGREKVRALAHELAHEVLHQAERAKALAAKRAPPRRTHAEEETEADATAYVVCGVLGVPVKAPTYIAWQGGDGTQVLRSMTRIQRAAKAILEAASPKDLWQPQTNVSRNDGGS
jgi:hypothetical protein